MEPEYTGEKLELQLVAANLRKDEMEQELEAAQRMRRPAQLTSRPGLDFSATGLEGLEEPERFKRNVAEDLAAASCLPSSNFHIGSVLPGSVMLGAEIMPELSGPEPSSTAADLRGSKITSNFTIKASFGSVRQAPQTVDNKEANQGLSMTKQGPDDSHTKKSSAGTIKTLEQDKVKEQQGLQASNQPKAVMATGPPAGVGMVLKEIKMHNEVPVLGWFGADMLLSVEALTPGAPAISSGKIFPGDNLIAGDS